MKNYTKQTQSNSGWVSVHRKLQENPIYSKPNYLSVWIHLLLSANHQDRKIIVDNKPFLIKRGQYFGSIKKIAETFHSDDGKTTMSKSTVHYILNYFELERMIERNKNGKYSLITIINYDDYQTLERPVRRQENVRRTSGETNNNDNNVNNVNNNITDEESSEVSKERNKQIGECIKLFEPLNPSYKILFNRKPQRQAMNELIEQYTYEKIKNLLNALPEVLNDRYAPTITTPYQLREKMGQVMQFMQKKRAPVSGKKGGVFDARNI